ncbi:MAG: hypothetical protein AAFY28_19990, partial [Actinomycetota bacterium]
HRSFGDWLKTDFADFWTHHLPKAFHAVGHWIHDHTKLFVTIVVVIAIVIVIVVLVVFFPESLAIAGDVIADAASNTYDYVASFFTTADAGGAADGGGLGSIDFDSDPEAGLDSDEDDLGSDNDNDYGHSPDELDVADNNTRALLSRIESFNNAEAGINLFQGSDEFTGFGFVNTG